MYVGLATLTGCITTFTRTPPVWLPHGEYDRMTHDVNMSVTAIDVLQLVGKAFYHTRRRVDRSER
jgi:hypothetical protein